MLKKIIFLVISALILTYISNEIYVKLYEWNDPQNCFKKEYVGTIGYAGECKGKLIVSNDILRKLVNGEYNGNKIKEYGFLVKIITNYDDDNIFTGQVTDMSALFLNKEVEYVIEDWNTSNVTNMSSMFEVNKFKNDAVNSASLGSEMDRFSEKDFELVVTSELKENIGNWNVSKVIYMSSMFSGRQFNKPLNNWDVSSVTDMSMLFYNNKKFNQPLNNWNVNNVKNMYYMFYNNKKFNQPLNNWDVSIVNNMSNMFSETEKFNQPLNNWNVSNVTDISSIFFLAKSFNQPLNNWKNKNLEKKDFKYSGMEEKNLPELNNEKR